MLRAVNVIHTFRIQSCGATIANTNGDGTGSDEDQYIVKDPEHYTKSDNTINVVSKTFFQH